LPKKCEEFWLDFILVLSNISVLLDLSKTCDIHFISQRREVPFSVGSYVP